MKSGSVVVVEVFGFLLKELCFEISALAVGVTRKLLTRKPRAPSAWVGDQVNYVTSKLFLWCCAGTLIPIYKNTVYKNTVYKNTVYKKNEADN